MRLTSLHFLRAMGAIFIVVSHSHGVIRKRFETLEFTDYFWQVEQGYTKVFGALGVDLFLVLSGFFAFYTTWNRKQDAMNFLKKRIIRIYPIWWVGLACLLILSLVPGASANYSLYEVVNSILLNPIYIDGSIKPILEIGWTLHYIVFYYLAMTLLISMKFQSIEILRILTIGFACLSVIGVFIDTTIPIIEVITNSRTLAFALGGWLAFIVIEKPIKWSGFYTVMTLFVIFILALAFIFIDSWRLSAPTLLSRSSMAFFIILLFVFQPKLKGLKYPKVFNLWGDASYSIYLFHMFPLMIVSGLWKRGILLPPNFLPPFVTWFILICLGVLSGVIAYKLFEKPIFTYFKNKLTK